MTSFCNPFSQTLRFRVAEFYKIPADSFGVYAIWHGRRCIYVGKAEDQSIGSRLQQHWNQSHNGYLQCWIESKGRELKVSYKAISDKHRIDTYERYFIKRFQPIANSIRYEQAPTPYEYR